MSTSLANFSYDMESANLCLVASGTNQQVRKAGRLAKGAQHGPGVCNSQRVQAEKGNLKRLERRASADAHW
jgi:hypothetical protein